MVTFSRRADITGASMQQRGGKAALLPDESYNSNKPRMQPALRAIISARLIAFLAFALLILYCVFDSPPAYFLRSAFSLFSTASANTVVSNDIVLDAVTEATAQNARPQHLRQLTTLIMVAGHAVYTGRQWDLESLHDEKNWVLESFQRGQVPTFLRHIKTGVEMAVNDSTALLLFSGGQTRRNTGPRSEGLTYWMAADSMAWSGQEASDVRNRTYAEEYARDSMENLLFSICRFNQLTGRYPHVIKVVGFEFKRYRFVDYHRRALRFPAHRFQYYGIDPENVNGIRGVTAGERARALGPFSGDPYGCHSPVLNSKRQDRNPYIRYHPYPQGCPELSALFRHCSRSLFKGPLPWDPRVGTDEDRKR
ncbi:hypothetical protein FGB62_2g238 [Gracilaria domingensis]|nr:hypothetical protein FGB62_2g238 [Gracilaria domingensis]